MTDLQTIDQLTAIECRSLRDYETTIEQGLQTFYAVGAALMAIREQRLYRASHSTFEDYCRDRWSMSKTSANRLITAADVVNDLTPIGVIPANEAQARPLASLPAEQRREVWQQVVEKSDKPTAKDVQAAVQRHASQLQDINRWDEWEIDGLTARHPLYGEVHAPDQGALKELQRKAWLNWEFANAPSLAEIDARQQEEKAQDWLREAGWIWTPQTNRGDEGFLFHQERSGRVSWYPSADAMVKSLQKQEQDAQERLTAKGWAWESQPDQLTGEPGFCFRRESDGKTTWSPTVLEFSDFLVKYPMWEERTTLSQEQPDEQTAGGTWSPPPTRPDIAKEHIIYAHAPALPADFEEWAIVAHRNNLRIGLDVSGLWSLTDTSGGPWALKTVIQRTKDWAEIRHAIAERITYSYRDDANTTDMPTDMLKVAEKSGWTWHWAEQREGQWHHCFTHRSDPEREHVFVLDVWQKTFVGIGGYGVAAEPDEEILQQAVECVVASLTDEQQELLAIVFNATRVALSEHIWSRVWKADRRVRVRQLLGKGQTDA